MTYEVVSRLFYEKFSKKILSEKEHVKKYTVSEPQEKARVLSLYRIRNDIYKQQKGHDNIEFTNLLKALEGFHEQKIIMHIIESVNGSIILLTDVNSSKIVAHLFIRN
jgi:hypothetical protein